MAHCTGIFLLPRWRVRDALDWLYQTDNSRYGCMDSRALWNLKTSGYLCLVLLVGKLSIRIQKSHGSRSKELCSR